MFFVLDVFLLFGGGLTLLVFAFIGKDINWQFLVGGISCFFGIFFAWAFKQILDGFALIVYNAAVELHDKNVQTSIDVE